MSDKQTFAAILGGLIFVLLGGLLIVPMQLAVQLGGSHGDGGDDGWGLLWVLLMILSGIVGLPVCQMGSQTLQRFSGIVC